jgi:hypothetical protein
MALLFPAAGEKSRIRNQGCVAAIGVTGTTAMVREGPAQKPPPRDDDPPPYPAERARGGRIVLRTPLQRALFIGGLVGAILLLLLLRMLGAA